MKVLVLVASGAIGMLLVDQLLNAGQLLKIIIRLSSKTHTDWSTALNLEIIHGYIYTLTID